MEEKTTLCSRIKFSCLRDLKAYDETAFQTGIEMVKSIFNVKKIYHDQETVLRKFFRGQNVYFSAPTGYGKSLIFQSIPIVADYLLSVDLFTSIILVISPLKSLMLDQVNYLQSIGLNAVAITGDADEDLVNAVKEIGCSPNLIYVSPESMLAVKKWRDILFSENFKERCVGVVVDEAHCISHWGYASASNSPFRKWYRNLYEFRLLLDSSVKFAVFTATATTVTKNRIFETLGMGVTDCYCVEKSPLKENIKFTSTYISNELTLEDIFDDTLNDISARMEHSDRVIIYCQSRKQCALLWQMFSVQLGIKLYLNTVKNPRKRLVEMFHAGTPTQVKEHIIEQASKKDSHLRIIICTVAFGMGVNCASFNKVIHFGPSKNIESYVQECGRAGRDGEESFCHLLHNNLLTSRCEDDMKEYVYSESCCRLTIAKWFGCLKVEKESLCSCCDKCALQCECDANCKDALQYRLRINAKETSRNRKVPRSKINELHDLLNDYLQKMQNIQSRQGKTMSYVVPDFEFSEFQVNQVLKNCNQIFTLEDVMSKVEVWRTIHAQNILYMLGQVFPDIDVGEMQLQFPEENQNAADEIPSEWMEVRDDSMIGLPTESSLWADIDSILDTTLATFECDKNV